MVSSNARLTHAPPHAVSPTPQESWQREAEQNCPRGHATRHAPQLAASRLVFTSHPLAALASQLAASRLQTPTPHVPAVQTAVPLATAQARSQAPQFPRLVPMLVSHPSSGSALQSANPAPHAMRHRPATHDDVPLVELQTSPHAPQLRASPVVLTSHPLIALPSQSPKPARQTATVHALATQPAVALANAQARPQPPQWAGLLAVSTHAPAHSVAPAAHVA